MKKLTIMFLIHIGKCSSSNAESLISQRNIIVLLHTKCLGTVTRTRLDLTEQKIALEKACDCVKKLDIAAVV